MTITLTTPPPPPTTPVVTLGSPPVAPAGAAAIAAAPAPAPAASPATAIAVPDVTEETEQDATNILVGFGFKATSVPVPAPGTVGEVYGQQPRPDDLAQPGSEVRIFVIAEQEPQATNRRFDQIRVALEEITGAVSAVGRLLAESDNANQERFQVIVQRLDDLSTQQSASAGSASSSKKATGADSSA